jgi:biopolymer transport protein ExbD
MPQSRANQPKVTQAETTHYEPPRKRRKQGGGKQQPPLTPMIDVTFQLLLYFLMTSSFQPDEGQIPGSLPKAGAASESPVTPIKIALRPAGTYQELVQYHVDRLPPITRPAELLEILKGRKQAYGDRDDIPVTIDVHSQVRWKYVTEAFNAASRAKFKKIAFATRG